MATSFSNSNVLWNASPSANLQAWTGKIEALLSAGGWVQTADTGQTAAASLAAATTGNEVRGYQIWRTNDGLTNVYVKFEFGSGNVATNPALWLTIGTGSDGSGNITGVLVPRTSNLSIGGSSTATFIGCCSPGYLVFYIGAGPHFLFSIERTKDPSGADTSDGVMVVWDAGGAASSVTSVFRLLRFSGTTPPNSTYWGVSFPSGTTWALGANIGVSPVRFFDGQPTNPSTNLLGYLNADIAELSTVTVNLYGSNRTYFTVGSTRFSQLAGNSNSTSTLMIRYE